MPFRSGIPESTPAISMFLRGLAGSAQRFPEIFKELERQEDKKRVLSEEKRLRNQALQTRETQIFQERQEKELIPIFARKMFGGQFGQAAELAGGRSQVMDIFREKRFAQAPAEGFPTSFAGAALKARREGRTDDVTGILDLQARSRAPVKATKPEVQFTPSQKVKEERSQILSLANQAVLVLQKEGDLDAGQLIKNRFDLERVAEERARMGDFNFQALLNAYNKAGKQSNNDIRGLSDEELDRRIKSSGG